MRFRDVAGRSIEFILADRIELERAEGGVGDHRHRRVGLSRREPWVSGGRQHVERGKIGERGERAAREDDRLAPDLVAEPAEDDEKGRAERERDGDQYVRGRAVDLQRFFEEEERIKLPRIPDDRSEEHTSELQSLMRIPYAVF